MMKGLLISIILLTISTSKATSHTVNFLGEGLCSLDNSIHLISEKDLSEKSKEDILTLSEKQEKDRLERERIEKEKREKEEIEKQKKLEEERNKSKSIPNIVNSVNRNYTVGQERVAFNQIIEDYQISQNDKEIWIWLINKESSWNTLATNPSSGAYGLPQSLPAEKMSVMGDDWRTNPYTQLKWQLDYIKKRYGTFQNLQQFWLANNWY